MNYGQKIHELVPRPIALSLQTNICNRYFNLYLFSFVQGSKHWEVKSQHILTLSCLNILSCQKIKMSQHIILLKKIYIMLHIYYNTGKIKGISTDKIHNPCSMAKPIFSTGFGFIG